MDMSWIVAENVSAVRESKVCPHLAIAGILNGVALSETEVIQQYTLAIKGIKDICAANVELEPMCNILVKMLLEIIQDEGDHDASAKKAAALCMGYKAAKPDEYNTAAKEV